MAVHYKTQGLVLKKIDKGDFDQIFSVFAKDFGRLDILGRAIRKIKSKLRAGTDLFYVSDFEFIQGKTFKTLTDACLIEKQENIRKEENRFRIAFKIGNLVNDFIIYQDKDEDVFNILKETFNKLNDLSFLKINLLYCYFVWNFLSILGYSVDLHHCSICRKKLIPSKLYFDQGILCLDCLLKNRNLSFSEIQEREVSPDIIKILRLLLKRDWNILDKLVIKEEYFSKLEIISEKYILKSRDFYFPS